MPVCKTNSAVAVVEASGDVVVVE